MANKQTNKLSLREKIGYGFGDFGNGFMFDLGQLYLLKFYTDVLGISSALGGLVFLVSKLSDAFVDSAVGTYVDSRTNIGKRGKFRPFILFGTIPLALLTILTFLSPNLSKDGRVIYAFATYILFNAAYSIVNIPYGSLAASMTQDSVERTSLASFRMAGSYGAMLLCGMTVIPLTAKFANPKIGYPIVVGVLSLIGMIAHLLCYKNVKENVVVTKKAGEKVPVSKIFKSLLTNRPLIALLLVFLFSITTQFMKMGVQIFYLQYNLGNIKLISSLTLYVTAFQFLGLAFVPILTKFIGKKNAFIVGLVIAALTDILNFVLPTNLNMFRVLYCISNFGGAITGSLAWALISDVIEYSEWKTGERTEGIIYSTCSFFRKLAQALAGFIPGIVLAMIGYVPNAVQSAGTLQGIKQIMFLYPAIFGCITALVLIFMYNLSDKKYKEIVAELAERRKVSAESANPVAN